MNHEDQREPGAGRTGRAVAVIIAAGPVVRLLVIWTGRADGPLVAETPWLATEPPGITVVNPDGRVNDESFAAARGGRLASSMLENVEVLPEKPGTGYLYHAPGELDTLQAHCQPWMGEELWSRE